MTTSLLVFTVDKPLPPNMAFDLTLIGATNATISNGVYTLPLIEPFDNGGITDASGNIVYWIFNCCETVAGSEVALSTWNAPDYLGVQDSAFRHNLDGTVNEANNRDVPWNLEFRTSDRSRPRCDTYVDLSGAGYAARF